MSRAVVAAPPRQLAVPGAALPADHWFALAAVATLPFAYALTLNLRFPFKLYELALLLAGAAVAVRGALRSAPGAWRLLRPLWPFVVLVGVVLVARILSPLPTINRGTFTTRFGPAGEGLTKYAYFLFSVFGFVVASYAAFRDERLYARVWLAGAAAAAGYTWLLFAASVLNFPPPLLPGMAVPQFVDVAGRQFIRSGTFQEGNHLGLYLVCSTAIALHARRYFAAVALSVTTFISFSTVNVIALSVLWLGVGWTAATAGRRGAGRVAAAVGFAAVAAGGLLAFAATGYAAEIVFNKLGAPDSVSRLDRLDQTIAGLRMAADYPAVGVGISQYGYHYRTYQVTTLFGQGDQVKPHPNNVYVELLSETGVIGTVLVGLFLLGVYRRARRRDLVALRWGFVAMMVVFGTFPSYTLMFLWAYWALIVAVAARPPARDVAA